MTQDSEDEDLSRLEPDISVCKYFERIIEDNNKVIDTRFKALEELLEQRFVMQDRALALANKNMEMRLEKLNELRNEVLQDRSRYVTNDRYETQRNTLEERVKMLEMWQSKMYGIAIGIALVAGISGGLVAKIFG